MRFVIFSGGEFTPSKLTKKAIKDADIIIAADSGADTALSLGITPSVVIGDMDSISKSAKNKLAKQITLGKMPTTLLCLPTNHSGPLNDSEKDQTDTELAIDYAVQHGATEITILGGNKGTRFDHIIANLLKLTQYTIPIYLIDYNQISWVTRGPKKEVINGKKGDILSLIPLMGDVSGITSKNLYYPLKNATLVFGKPRGVSNIFTANTASVNFKKGTLLFVHTTHDEEE